MRPKRLFGFDGTAGKDPSSSTGLMSLGAFGLSPATAPGTLTRAAIRKLQGGLSAGLKPRDAILRPRDQCGEGQQRRNNRDALQQCPGADRSERTPRADTGADRDQPEEFVVDMRDRHGAGADGK